MNNKLIKSECKCIHLTGFLLIFTVLEGKFILLFEFMFVYMCVPVCVGFLSISPITVFVYPHIFLVLPSLCDHVCPCVSVRMCVCKMPFFPIFFFHNMQCKQRLI